MQIIADQKMQYNSKEILVLNILIIGAVFDRDGCKIMDSKIIG
jgi:hypothetical protein